MILVLGGTSEAVTVVNALRKKGFAVFYSKATTYPQAITPDWQRKLTVAELKKVVEAHKVKLIVDATHPFAQKIKAVAQKLCQEKQLPYLRYERPFVNINYHLCFLVNSLTEAAHKAASLGKRILVLSGVKTIEPLLKALASYEGVQCFARVLDWPPSLTKAQTLLGAENVVAGYGRFHWRQNLAVMEKFAADVVITKDSGQQGGLKEKIKAAQAKGIPVVLLKRPAPSPEAVFSLKVLLDKVEEVVCG